MRKKLLSSLLALMLVGLCACGTAAPKADAAYVTIVTGGQLTAVDKTVELADLDGDGATTINDVLIGVHQQYAPNKGDDYATAKGQYGLGITKLWGIEQGSSYGYYLNDVMPMGLTETVKADDHLVAYAYSDTVGFSDKYAYFDKKEATVKSGASLDLTLSYIGFDASFNAVVSPLAQAVLTVDGQPCGVNADASGKASVTMTSAGEHVISASAEGMVLVPPFCVVTVK